MEYNTHTDSFSGHASGKGVEITLGHEKGQTTVNRPATFDTHSGYVVEGDVLSTAMTPTGAPVLGREVSPSDTIKVHGQRMTVGMAQSLGFLNRDRFGTFEATREGTAGAPKAEAPKGQTALASGGTAEEAAESSFRGSERAEALLSEATNTVPIGLQAAAMDEFMANDGELSPHLLQRVADAARMSPADAAATISVSGVCVPLRFAVSALRPISDFSSEISEGFQRGGWWGWICWSVRGCGGSTEQPSLA